MDTMTMVTTIMGMAITAITARFAGVGTYRGSTRMNADQNWNQKLKQRGGRFGIPAVRNFRLSLL